MIPRILTKFFLVFTSLLLVLIACNSPAIEPPTTAPAAVTLASSTSPLPSHEPDPTLTPLPPATSTPLPPSPTPTTSVVSTATLAAALQATVIAGLPATATPDSSGFTPGGFDKVNVLPLAAGSDRSDLWAVFSQGFRNLDRRQNHFVAIYTLDDTDWREVSRLELENADYLIPTSVRQVPVEPGHIWLEVQPHRPFKSSRSWPRPTFYGVGRRI